MRQEQVKEAEKSGEMASNRGELFQTLLTSFAFRVKVEAHFVSLKTWEKP